MSPPVYQAFETICARESIRGPVLEVGAVPGPDSLLRMKCLREASPKFGINMDTALVDEACEFVKGNANEMTYFADGQFQSVICNATLEHDPYFWKTIAEIHRVTAPGGLVVIGVPGYAGMGVDCFAPPKSFVGRMLRLIAKATNADVLMAGTVTLGEHFFPGDYYRFSEQAVREIFLGGLANVSVVKVMNPPRIIGWGRKP